MSEELIEKELSYKIMQAAFEVHNQLGPGFPESIYNKAMTRELVAQGMEVEQQKQILVYYKGKPLGEFFLDNVVNRCVILELKAVSELAPIHEQQALSYLKATGLLLAIVINFGTPRVTYKRVVNTTSRYIRSSHTFRSTVMQP
jgi:GxxExxY protein